MTPEEKKQLLDRAAADVAEEETLAAAREIERKKNAKDAVLPVRLGADLYADVQAIAMEQKKPASVVVRQWIAQGVASARNTIDVVTELERLAASIRASAAGSSGSKTNFDIASQSLKRSA